MTSYKVPNYRDAKIDALIDSYNDLQEKLSSDVTDGYHRSKTSTGGFKSTTALTVTAANANSESTLYTLVNQLRGVMMEHFADDQAHLLADTTNLNFADSSGDGYVDATTEDTAVALANAMKVDLTAHQADTTVHVNADTGYTITAPDATDEASAITLVNDIKVMLNGHMADAPETRRIRLV